MVQEHDFNFSILVNKKSISTEILLQEIQPWWIASKASYHPTSSIKIPIQFQYARITPLDSTVSDCLSPIPKKIIQSCQQQKSGVDAWFTNE